jgi:2-amino-4-hydroxy-6-hydroxymethyldihydropteridine diphosphokinase
VNAVIEIETEFDATRLLKQLKAIETAMGRKRVRGKRWGSRIIDLDILFFDNELINKRNLKIPHPELQNRRFVLAPLAELAPQLIHPKLALSVSELLAALRNDKKVHLLPA